MRTIVDELMMNLIDELDNLDGYADGFRCYDMCELDDFFCDCKVSEFLQKLAPDFDLRDGFFYYTIYGISSTSDKAELYKDNTDAGEIFNEVLKNIGYIYIADSEFASLMCEIVSYTDKDDNEVA